MNKPIERIKIESHSSFAEPMKHALFSSIDTLLVQWNRRFHNYKNKTHRAMNHALIKIIIENS